MVSDAVLCTSQANKCTATTKTKSQGGIIDKVNQQGPLTVENRQMDLSQTQEHMAIIVSKYSDLQLQCCGLKKQVSILQDENLYLKKQNQYLKQMAIYHLRGYKQTKMQILEYLKELQTKEQKLLQIIQNQTKNIVQIKQKRTKRCQRKYSI